MNKLFQCLSIISLSLLINGNAFNHTDGNEINSSDSTNVKSDPNFFQNQNDPWVEKTLSSMTLEEKAGQVVFPHAYGKYMSEDSPDYERLVHLVKDLKVGGIIFFLSNIYDQAIVTNKLQQISKSLYLYLQISREELLREQLRQQSFHTTWGLVPLTTQL